MKFTIKAISSNIRNLIDETIGIKTQRTYKSNSVVKDGFFVNQGAYEQSKINDISKITPNFKREFIEQGKIAEIKINLAMPKDELVAYIIHIKDYYNNDIRILKSPAELFGNQVQEAGKPPKKKSERWADMFFVYDYVKARQNCIKEQNKSNEAELEAEIENIKKYHIGIDRKKRVAFAKAEYLESTINTKITDIFKEDELTKILELKADNISKLYYAIKPYIDDLKYKELLTGVSTI